MDSLYWLFPVSGVKTYIFIPPLVALIVSFFTSMGGVSGAFLLLPFQVSFLNFTSPSVSATAAIAFIGCTAMGIEKVRPVTMLNNPAKNRAAAKSSPASTTGRQNQRSYVCPRFGSADTAMPRSLPTA